MKWVGGHTSPAAQLFYYTAFFLFVNHKTRLFADFSLLFRPLSGNILKYVLRWSHKKLGFSEIPFH